MIRAVAHEATEGKASACSLSLPVLSLGTELSLHLRSDGLSSQLLAAVFQAEQRIINKEEAGVFSSLTKDQRVSTSALKAD